MQSMGLASRCLARHRNRSFAALWIEDMDSLNLPDPQLAPASHVPAPESKLQRLANLTVPVSVQLGHRRLALQSLCHLSPGSIIPLDMPCQEPQMLVANGLKLAMGQVVRSGTHLGFRIQRSVTETASQK